MNIKLEYTANHKTENYMIFEGEVYVRLTKMEAIHICRRHFIWDRPAAKWDKPFEPSIVEIILERGMEKARKVIYAEYALRRDQYDLEVEISYEQEELFTNRFIKDFFKWLLEDAIQMRNGYGGIGITVDNDFGLRRFFEDAIRVFEDYYIGDLSCDAVEIQKRIIRRHEKGLI